MIGGVVGYTYAVDNLCPFSRNPAHAYHPRRSGRRHSPLDVGRRPLARTSPLALNERSSTHRRDCDDATALHTDHCRQDEGVARDRAGAHEMADGGVSCGSAWVQRLPLFGPTVQTRPPGSQLNALHTARPM